MTTQQSKTKAQPVQNQCIQCAASEMMQMLHRDLMRDGYTINRDQHGTAVSISKNGRTLEI